MTDDANGGGPQQPGDDSLLRALRALPSPRQEQGDRREATLERALLALPAAKEQGKVQVEMPEGAFGTFAGFRAGQGGKSLTGGRLAALALCIGGLMYARGAAVHLRTVFGRPNVSLPADATAPLPAATVRLAFVPDRLEGTRNHQAAGRDRQPRRP